MAFHVVGVEFNETGQQEVAFEIFALGRTLADLGDQPVTDDDMAVDHPISKNHTRIAQDLFGGHFMSPSSGGRLARNCDNHATA
jgi:hypothetical protein